MEVLNILSGPFGAFGLGLIWWLGLERLGWFQELEGKDKPFVFAILCASVPIISSILILALGGGTSLVASAMWGTLSALTFTLLHRALPSGFIKGWGDK